MFKNLIKTVEFHREYLARKRKEIDNAILAGTTLEDFIKGGGSIDKDDLLQLQLVEALRGDNESAHSCLERYVDAVDAGTNPHPALLEFVAYGLSGLLAGEKGEVAFFLKPRVGAPKRSRISPKEMVYFIRVRKLVQQGVTVKDAIARTAKQFGGAKKESAIKKAYYKWRNLSDEDFNYAAYTLGNLQRKQIESLKKVLKSQNTVLESLLSARSRIKDK